MDTERQSHALSGWTDFLSFASFSLPLVSRDDIRDIVYREETGGKEQEEERKAITKVHRNSVNNNNNEKEMHQRRKRDIKCMQEEGDRIQMRQRQGERERAEEERVVYQK